MTGVLYCSVIAGCQQVFALDRAREWTQALERWWQAQPQIVAFAASCLVHRAELLELDGAWPHAIDEAQRAATAQNRAVEPQAAASGLYRQGEIHRLRGEYAQAEQAYRQANELGRDPQPGLALMRLAQGQYEAAANAIRRVLISLTLPLRRAQFLPAFCEIMLAVGDVEQARAGSSELRAIASDVGSEFLSALSVHALAAVAIAQAQPEAALEPLRRALAVWQRVPAPYLVARLRVLLARAYAALGDHDSANLECDAARPVFMQLGAAPDLAGLAIPTPARPAPKHKLSARELEVLRLVATGKTNKQIARELHLSEKTIDRHVSNIFAKIEVNSRAAATAYAYEQELV
jgi:DNA-binding CsgD family transcriptional regulator/predicted DCC family thiol-disulfide oxidoreductase YuxK